MPMTDPLPRLRNRFLSNPTEPVQPGDFGQGAQRLPTRARPGQRDRDPIAKLFERRRAFRLTFIVASSKPRQFTWSFGRLADLAEEWRLAPCCF
jgi:hypothetical protein